MQVSTTYKAGGEFRLRLRSAYSATRLRTKTPRLQDAKSESDSHLSIAAKPKNGNKTRAGFGRMPAPTAFTGLARANVREGVAALETRYGRMARFCTVTIPGSTERAYATVAEWSGWINQNLQQWVRDNAPGSGVVTVWELQKRGALHLHLLVATLNRKALQRIQTRWKRYLFELLLKVSVRSGVDIFERADGGTWRDNYRVFRANVETPRKSLSRYMSKYLSKGSQGVVGYSPTRWWSINELTRSLARSLRRCWVEGGWQPRTAQVFASEVAALLRAASTKSFSYGNEFDRLAKTWIFYVKSDDEPLIWDILTRMFSGQHVDALGLD